MASSTCCGGRPGSSGCRPATPAPASSSARRCRSHPRTRDRVTVTTSSGVHAGPLAEFAFFGLLAFAKDLPTLLADQRERHWPAEQHAVGELRDRTLLIVGLGEIGTETARLAQAFGMRVLAVKRDASGGRPTSTSSIPQTSCPSL